MNKILSNTVLFIALILPNIAQAQDGSWGRRTEQQTKADWRQVQNTRKGQPTNPNIGKPFTGHDRGYRNGTTGMQYPYGLRERRPEGWGTQPRKR